mmetsp:Transcript_17185/g.35295  ORF Transcript_17185/g.35295 Transcript_17185/m.35295 type:complete len:279 (-) Transcript_17185:137-973(-)|eukprot:CAMPEP_0201118178 /NCGR_PEP_ID=MMETSP0850-20130426/2299_1 /ASSEMBLY_ACC=CAM_ASM_000622 /TAXON_ID=183588 /ORGANISM="Pseudo-nitzschia fraudulenta, Strain WWA7" /LENGTH=278 /DNA_ID=CAMNT_0047383171 /DNA_START=159 /DNA_END=995 /DNA_ORIENTATION=-
MPRYSDEWLIDKTMFDYVQGGSCACCSGFLFMPGGTAGLIRSMSEFETDAANAEVSALEQLPWPQEMKDEVWKERVRLRQYCKKNMVLYKTFWEEHGEEYQSWFHELTKQKLCRYFQLARTEVTERLQHQKFHMHAAFGTVLCAVTEQVAHFPVTKYPIDGRGAAEIGFESILAFDRRGGFTLRDDMEETRTKWLIRHKTLGGPKLLERNAKKFAEYDSDDEDMDGEKREEEEEENVGAKSSTPSFRSDRRIIRLLIARAFADTLQQAFLKDLETKRE